MCDETIQRRDSMNKTIFPIGENNKPKLDERAEKKLQLKSEVMTLFRSHNLTAGDALHVLELCSSEIKGEASNFVLR